jgi:prepilin-type N-terminal cleavage/methylation domain-containing protein
MSTRGAFRSEAGFTLVEVLVAMFILLVGVLGTVQLVDGANAETNAADTRVGATNLAREITEDVHAVDYDSLLTGTVVPALRTVPTLAGTLSGSTWVITRRGERYTVSATGCKYDSPSDGIAASHDATYCSNVSSTASSPADPNGDDFRRVDVTISWTSQGGQPHTLRQTAMIVNPSGGLGPRITSFTHVTQLVQPFLTSLCSTTADCVQTTNSSSPLNFNVTTATPAASLHWSASDGSSDTLTPATDTTSFPWTWNVSSVLDGTYTVNAQAFDDRGVPGDVKTATLVINASKPQAPAQFTGGWDLRVTPIVDLRWHANPEGDIVGYRVYRDENGTRVQVCPPATGTATVLAADSSRSQYTCDDANPPDPTTTPNPTYEVVAVDLIDAMAPDSASNEREGDPATFTVASPDVAPTFPTNGGTLSSSVTDGLPTISWTDPATDADGSVLFYRIYRDPSSTSPLPYSARYDYTTGSATTYSDPDPGSTLNHVYYVTAVDDRFNESPPIGPFPAIP